MSGARNTLLDLFLHGGDGSQPEFEQALDDFAHELAEKIRTEERNWGGWAGTSFGLRRAAELIDPEVS